jgi:hypothetical protein
MIRHVAAENCDLLPLKTPTTGFATVAGGCRRGPAVAPLGLD